MKPGDTVVGTCPNCETKIEATVKVDVPERSEPKPDSVADIVDTFFNNRGRK